MTRFQGGALKGSSELGYEQTLEALLSLIGRPVLVLFSGTDRSPCAISVLVRGELTEALER